MDMETLKNGKSGLSQTNLEDISGALNIVKFFDRPACAVMKHVNHSGAAVALPGESVKQVYIKARDCDARAAFGSVIAFNVEVDKETVDGIEEPVDADMKALGCDENRRALIFSPFGGCSDTGSVLLFFFTEARFTNDNYQYDNEDNFMVMKLNPITGKVLFLADEE